jgi:hypothetical protein
MNVKDLRDMVVEKLDDVISKIECDRYTMENL